MYTKLEITIIFKNCSDYKELYAACNIFNWMITRKLMQKSATFTILATLRFRQLTKENSK